MSFFSKANEGETLGVTLKRATLQPSRNPQVLPVNRPCRQPNRHLCDKEIQLLTLLADPPLDPGLCARVTSGQLGKLTCVVRAYPLSNYECVCACASMRALLSV